MSEYQPPCKDNPDQWYTERDGRRYDDEVLVDVEQIMANLDGEPFGAVEEAVEDALEEVVKQRVIERRQARDKCFGCKVRLQCLDTALTNREQYGIWGGYFPEQRRTLERSLDARRDLLAIRESRES